jgi:hypothetical protein
MLKDAIPLVDKRPVTLAMIDIKSEYLLSFLPWWSRNENRTICFVADSMIDAVYFYADVDKYPLNFVT